MSPMLRVCKRQGINAEGMTGSNQMDLLLSSIRYHLKTSIRHFRTHLPWTWAEGIVKLRDISKAGT